MRSIGSAAIFAADIGECAAHDALAHPACLGHHHDRTIFAIERLELSRDIADGVDGQMDGKRRSRRSEGGELLAFGHARGAARDAGQHDALRDLGHGQFAPDCRRCCGEGRNARRQTVRNAAPFEPPQLLRERAIDRQISRMEARHVEALFMRRHEFGLDLIKRERRGIDDARGLRAISQKLARNDGAGIETDRTARDQVTPA